MAYSACRQCPEKIAYSDQNSARTPLFCSNSARYPKKKIPKKDFKLLLIVFFFRRKSNPKGRPVDDEECFNS